MIVDERAWSDFLPIAVAGSILGITIGGVALLDQNLAIGYAFLLILAIFIFLFRNPKRWNQFISRTVGR